MGTVVLKSVINRGVVGLALVLTAVMPITAQADKTDDILNSGLSRQRAGAESQKRIDAISEQTEKTVAQYQQQRKNVEVLKKFNDRMRRTLDAQVVAMQKLERSIEDASQIERQIVPLMLSMIDGLERFIDADIPFKLDERRARVKRIKGYLTNANISAAERFRQVLEAYSTESAYGNSIDVFTEELDLPSGKLAVNILQVGRSGLYYLTTDGQQAGYWDVSDKQWKPLDSSHNAGITDAIRMTQGKDVKDLMVLPTRAPEAI
ncbi:DUF3450 domain-containing protein [Arenicella chitinivorans]|uniref:DUF3450 domain-containing protein n=1 Tax=Arenicella chitinivorans TaxID=1329800 RepID=A0A918RV38_9GAMM|nr:DUF3450 domain-containing protein [Arenicella chitinivorans]GHA12363.1 DUF3450 domain-containing protein [Arenicella chitinivorans]